MSASCGKNGAENPHDVAGACHGDSVSSVHFPHASVPEWIRCVATKTGLPRRFGAIEGRPTEWPHGVKPHQRRRGGAIRNRPLAFHAAPAPPYATSRVP